MSQAHGNSPEHPGPHGQRTAAAGVVAAIDYGDVRIGVALSDAGRTMALPHATYQRRAPAADAEWFRSLVRDYVVTLLVVGLPVHLDGGESPKSREARRFAAWLAAETGVPAVFFDERFTTAEAEEELRTRGLTAKARKARRDMLAAQILLRDFIAGGCQGQEAPQGLDD
jgi:putative Holliday junction resolvase